MRVLNVHERVLRASPADVGALIDSLASPHDRLWPCENWPPMRFDGPLAVGAKGGHGLVRYAVEGYAPGRSIQFRFSAPAGFNGGHGITVEAAEGGTKLVHTLEMLTSGTAVLSWPLLFQPLHDALLEDALDKAERSFGVDPTERARSARVLALRWLFGLRSRTRKKRSAPS